MMRLYRVRPTSDPGEWQILVVADNAKDARRMGWRGVPVAGDFIDMRVSWVRDMVIPDAITEPTVIDHCEEQKWTCQAWSHEMCPTSCLEWKPEYGEEE